MLDFVEPLWSGRNLGCVGRQAELERLEHGRKIGIRTRFCEGHKHGPARGEAEPRLDHCWATICDPSHNCGKWGSFLTAPSTVGGLGGVANVAGAEFSPRHLLGGRFPGEQVIKLSVPPFVPNF